MLCSFANQRALSMASMGDVFSVSHQPSAIGHQAIKHHPICEQFANYL
jgi:hypothetical protein